MDMGGGISAAARPPAPPPPPRTLPGFVCLHRKGPPAVPARPFSSEILIFEAFISLPERLKCKTALWREEEEEEEERGGQRGGHRPGHAHFGGHREGLGGSAVGGGVPIPSEGPPPPPDPPFLGPRSGLWGLVFLWLSGLG